MFVKRSIKSSVLTQCLIFTVVIFLVWSSPFLYGFIFPRYVLQSESCSIERCENCGLNSNTTTSPQCYIIAFSFVSLLLFVTIIGFSIFHWIYCFFCYFIEEEQQPFDIKVDE